MLEIHHRSQVSGFRQIVGIFIDGTDIADQDIGKIFITDIGSNYLISLCHCILAVHQLAEKNHSLSHHLQISGYDQIVTRGKCHTADIGIVGNNGSHPGPVRSYGRNASHQTASGDHIHIIRQPIIRAFVNDKRRIPVAGISADDPGTDLIVVPVFFIQLQQPSQFIQFIFVLLQQSVLFRQGSHLLLQGTVLR